MIDEGESFLLVGGAYTKSMASRYTEDRWVQDLDKLNVGRVLPACGWFIDSSGIRVGKKPENNCFSYPFYRQTL